MGITQVDLREAERFEEGIEPEFLDAEEESPKVPGEKPDSGHISSSSHGGYGCSSLQECLNLLNQARSNSPAPCHSGVGIDQKSNPQQVMSPNVEKNRSMIMTMGRPLTAYQRINHCCQKTSHSLE